MGTTVARTTVIRNTLCLWHDSEFWSGYWFCPAPLLNTTLSLSSTPLTSIFLLFIILQGPWEASLMSLTPYWICSPRMAPADPPGRLQHPPGSRSLCCLPTATSLLRPLPQPTRLATSLTSSSWGTAPHLTTLLPFYIYLITTSFPSPSLLLLCLPPLLPLCNSPP